MLVVVVVDVLVDVLVVVDVLVEVVDVVDVDVVVLVLVVVHVSHVAGQFSRMAAAISGSA